MTEIDFDSLMIKDVDDDGKSVLISSSADRPNAFNSYSASKKSAREVKEMFDAPFKLVKKKHNALVEAVVGKTNALDLAENERIEAERQRKSEESARNAAEAAREEAEREREEARATFEEIAEERFAAQDTKIENGLAAQDTKIENGLAAQDTKIQDGLAAQDERLSGRIGDFGSVVLSGDAWGDSLEQTVKVESLGEYDLVMFYPSTAFDRELCSLYGVFIEPEPTDAGFKITAIEKPSSDISLKYYIIRGSLPEISEVE